MFEEMDGAAESFGAGGILARRTMRKFLLTFVTAGLTSFAPVTSLQAAPVPGYETFYDATFAACTLPDGTVEACAASINAYTDALISGGVSLDEANSSFTVLRADVFAANAADEEFAALIDALFEELLPESGAIGPVSASPTA